MSEFILRPGPGSGGKSWLRMLLASAFILAGGQVDDNLMYVLGGLEIINERGPEKQEVQTHVAHGALWDEWWSGHKARALQHFGNENAEYFFYYWADKERLTEHGGGGVPGWLTDRGQKLMTLLQALRTEWKESDRP